MKYLLSIVLVLLLASSAMAQKPKAPKEKLAPGRTAATEEKAPPQSDSVKFKAAFKELYPLIRVTPTIKERAEAQLQRMSRMFKMQGIDSAHAVDSVMLALNPNEDETILFNAYRENFTADELKSLVAFFKTPSGKHYLEIEPRLVGARSGQIEQYIQRTINTVIMPMRKPMQRPPGMGPGGPGGMRGPGMRPRPGMRPGQPGMPPEGMPPPPEPPVMDSGHVH
ncbi:MAG: DUF2059 domain-containing protein [Bacteroidota bacterium]|nr:DUF2059 domain-containing protein [Bacteroidota bacterium]MDP4234284.1 DUF2059 domain-containing protein [Bacteroidota bacterium]MDP4243219.1 DUF2059 domain-containing protein [Bacteroidota bacterium]MDP4288075.1 DUF2059 domain-containing protein [Bacteroidota bacterium]